MAREIRLQSICRRSQFEFELFQVFPGLDSSANIYGENRYLSLYVNQIQPDTTQPNINSILVLYYFNNILSFIHPKLSASLILYAHS